MTAWSFNKSSSSELYIYNGGTGPTGYTTAFLQDPSKTVFPESISFDAAWQDGEGLYLFLNIRPPNEQSFVNAVRAYQQDPTICNARLLWIENPADPPAAWVTYTLAVTADSTVSSWKTAAFTQFSFNNYAVSIAANSGITTTTLAGLANQTGLVITKQQADGFSFSSGLDRAPLYSLGPYIIIPFEGYSIGCLTFDLTLAQSKAAAPDTDIGRLDAGLKYFYDTPGWEAYGYLSTLDYPVFDPAETNIKLYPCLDPINNLVPSRSFLDFLPPDGSAPQVLPSFFRTWVGRRINLLPKADGSPRLLFAVKPTNKDSIVGAPYYLVPSGQFVIQTASLANNPKNPITVTESNITDRIMCGLSAMEYIGYQSPASKTVANILQFITKQNAYSPTFSPNSSAGSTPFSGLKDNSTTAYLAFIAAEPTTMNYYSQPDDSVFFQPASFTSDPNSLGYMELISKVLPPVNAENPSASAIPMVPLAGLTADSIGISFEAMILNQVRANQIQSFAIPSMMSQTDDAAEQIVTATTQHGMLAAFKSSSATEIIFTSLQLAMSDAGINTFTLAGQEGGAITGKLRAALQTNKLFLVIDDQEGFERNGSFPAALLTIAGIPFNLSPDTWETNHTIIIYKYAGEAIDSLAADLSLWAFPSEFSQGGQTQSSLLTIIADIKKQYNNEDQDFEMIYRAITNPGWNGILAFNAEVKLSSLPGQLSGLAAGIDPAAFNAHHLGINLSPLKNNNGVLTMQDTSLFGLINYQDNSPFADDLTEYAFRVKMLKILFENSAIKNFACKIDLLVNQLFGIPVSLKASQAENIIELNGYYQRQQGRDIFVFTSSDDLSFTAVSEIMDEVELIDALYVMETTNAPANEQGIKHLEARFSFNGFLRFKAIPGFDCFSFGNDNIQATSGGLRFAGLNICMSFDQSTADDTVTNRSFTFDAQNLSIDMSVSKARSDSLYNHFPLTFKQVLQGKSSVTPSNLGYMACSTPVSESALIYPWFGLVFELNLGTIGALASSAGFTATLILAWSYGSGYAMFTGLKLPGACPQSLSFSLEGILGISIDDFRFIAQPTTDNHTAYTLVFSNLGLRLFGLKLPPSAYIDLVLFGNPDPGRRAASLGWYAAYTDEK